MGFLFFLFMFFVGGGWLIGKSIGNALFGKSSKRITYIDRTVHHHYYDNRSVHLNGDQFKNLK